MPLVVDAVIAAKKKIASIVGSDVVAAAEQQVLSGARSAQPAAPTALSGADMEWLIQWVDEQPDPSVVTRQQAEEALAAHHGGSASPNQLLLEAQMCKFSHLAHDIAHFL